MSEYPSEWSVRSLGEIAERVRRTSTDQDLDVLTISSTEGWVDQKRKWARDMAGKSIERYTLLQQGEFSYNRGNSKTYPQGCVFRLDSWDRALVPNVYHSFSITSPDIDDTYLKHFFSAGGLNDQLRSVITSSVRDNGLLNITADTFFASEIPVPSLPEQKKIAEILSGIDTLIHALTQQMQKLDASKAALSKKLMSGLQGPRKESLYGQIPEYWGESTLGEVLGVYNLQTGPFGSQLHAHEYTTEGIPVVMPQDMRKCRVLTDKIARITPERAQSLEKHKVTPGDILFSRRGDIGRHAIISQNESGWICGTGCLRARTNEAINPFFLSELLMHRYAMEWLNANAVGQTMLNLNTGILSGLPVVVPPKGEQDMIASTLNSISNRSEKISDKILFAQNLKASLSIDLLSGRKRVSV